MSFIKRALAVLMIVFVGSAVLATTSASAQFDPLREACDPELGASQSAVCLENEATRDGDPLTGNDSVLMRVIGILTIVVAVISVIIIVVAGMTMTLSAGDSAKIQSSRNAIIYALVGLVVTALSRTIIIFVINRVE